MVREVGKKGLKYQVICQEIDVIRNGWKFFGRMLIFFLLLVMFIQGYKVI